MDIKLPNEDFSMFKDDARQALFEHIAEYANGLKDEAERIAVVQCPDKEDAKVYKKTVESIIGIRGHHVFTKVNGFRTIILPLIDGICFSCLGWLFSVESKKLCHIIMLIICFAIPTVIHFVIYVKDLNK